MYISLAITFLIIKWSSILTHASCGAFYRRALCEKKRTCSSKCVQLCTPVGWGNVCRMIVWAGVVSCTVCGKHAVVGACLCVCSPCMGVGVVLGSRWCTPSYEEGYV
jgi:hypothetical protein